MDNCSEVEKNDLTGIQITVIGGAGFLARELISQLLDCGCGITVADITIKSNNLPPSLLWRKKHLKSGQLNVVYVDVSKPETLRNIPCDTKKVVHMGAHFSFWPVDEKKSWNVNVEGTKNVLEHSLNFLADCDTVLYYSSIEAVGSKNVRASFPGAKEYERPNFSELKGCPYKATKTFAHFVAEEYAPRFLEKGKKIILRAPPTPFGPGMECVSTGSIMTKHRGIIRLISPKTVLSCADTRDIARDDVLLLTKNGRIENGKTYVTVGFHAAIPEILKVKEKFTGIPAPKILLPNFSLVPLARIMETYGKMNKSYLPEITKEQAKRTTQNHFYDVSFTRKALGLNQENYFGLEETIKNTSMYLIERGIIPNYAAQKSFLLV